ncbi:MAG: hypothetical protein AAF533_25595 [Acidobacteriota bacterium]
MNVTPARLVVAFLALTTLPSAIVSACQDHPTIPCSLVPESPVVTVGEPFTVTLSVTNLPGNPAAPLQDDYEFVIDAQAFEAMVFEGEPPFGGVECWADDTGMELMVDPPSVTVTLDDARSAMPDDPVTWTGTFTITPTMDIVEGYHVQVNVCGGETPGRCLVQCFNSACVLAELETTDRPVPHATFLDPLQFGEAGGSLPFAMQVQRNSYDPTRELTVTVTPQNNADPIDIFPITPPELTTVGHTIEAGVMDELVEFSCGLHYPCFHGVYNSYHVAIHDGPLELWNSRYVFWEGLGVARVNAAPMARNETVEVITPTGGPLTACEDSSVHLRLYARNPYHMADLENVTISLDVPSDLEIRSAELHYHDNPLDAIDPPPAELEAMGLVERTGDTITITTPRIDHRYSIYPGPAPPVFRDLFEVELILDTPADGLLDASELAFSGVTVTGTVLGVDFRETSDPLVFPVEPGPGPLEVSVLGSAQPVTVTPDGTVSWEDGSESGATSFDLYRGEIASLAADHRGECFVAGLTAPSHLDVELSAGTGWFYLVRGRACGSFGPLGLDGQGDPRVADDCP